MKLKQTSAGAAQSTLWKSPGALTRPCRWEMIFNPTARFSQTKHYKTIAISMTHVSDLVYSLVSLVQLRNFMSSRQCWVPVYFLRTVTFWNTAPEKMLPWYLQSLSIVHIVVIFASSSYVYTITWLSNPLLEWLLGIILGEILLKKNVKSFNNVYKRYYIYVCVCEARTLKREVVICSHQLTILVETERLQGNFAVEDSLCSVARSILHTFISDHSSAIPPPPPPPTPPLGINLTDKFTFF